MVRDFYHKYTVDEHTLLTIRNLERLTDGGHAGASASRRCSRDLEAPELLVLALLLHDVGKWRDEDHAAESARMAAPAVRAAAISSRRRAELVEFLVANICKMSLVAFRRDTEDPEIVRQFAELVGVEERLKMLCLMTLADVEAVSRETLTPWKEELLWRLYVDTYNHLTLSLWRRSDRSRHRPLLGRSDAASSGRSRRPAEIGGVSRGLAAPLPAAVRARRHLPARAPVAQHGGRTSCTCCSNARTTPGS